MTGATEGHTATVAIDCRMADWSGVGRYTRGLLKGFASVDGVSLVLIVAPGASEFVPSEVEAIPVEAAHSPFSLSGMIEIGKIIEGHSPDVMHCLHFPTPWRCAAPLVVTLHDLTPLIVTDAMPSTMHRIVYRELNRRAVRMAARIITPSTATAADVGRVFPVAARKTVVIPEAADDFSAGAGDSADEGLPEPPYLLAMGDTKAHKGLPTLFSAFEQLAVLMPDLRLVLVGAEPDGYLDAVLSRTARVRASFAGRVDDARLRALYAGAAVFVFPSSYEGFGLPLLEAMSLGAPVVAASVASIPEVVGDAALLFPSGDAVRLAAAIAGVLEDDATRRSLRERGLARAAEFSWRDTARRTVEVYQSVLATPRFSAIAR